jgi:hypothetical protein
MQFKEVKLEAEPKEQESASGWSLPWASLLAMFLSFALVQSGFWYGAYKVPSLHNSTTLTYPLTQEFANRFADVRIRIDGLTKGHQFISLRLSLTRPSGAGPLSHLFDVNQTTELYHGPELSNRRSWNMKRRIMFSEGATVSNEVVLDRIAIRTIDAVNITLRAQTDFIQTKDLQFRYTFADPNAVALVGTLRLVLASCALYAVISWFTCRCLDILSAGHPSLTILAVMTTVATNPIALFVPSFDRFSVIPRIGFLSVYRFFVLSVLRGGPEALGETALTGAALLAIIYAGLEALAILTQTFSTVFETPLTICHIGYAVLVVGLLAHALTAHAGVRRVQEAATAVFAVIAAAATILSEVLFRTEASTLPLLLCQSSHVLSAVVFLFLQSATDAGAAINRKKLVPYDGDDGALDVDSDDEAQEDGLE